jgi:Flp pilus assembly protein TadD
MKRVYLQGAVPLMVLLLGACANTTVRTSRLPPLHDQPSFHVADLDVHAVSPEMEAFLHRYVSTANRLESRVWNLVWATTDRGVLPFKYTPNLTQTSVETFSSKAGNCLAFSNMLVAMARSQGLQAWYQEVEIPPNWSSTNNTVLVNMHINVLVRGGNDEWVVDISGDNVNSPRKIRRISDKDALAQHYNNLGAEALIDEDLARAYGYYAKAIETAPNLPFVWSNLGVVYSRNGQNEDARQAYLKALNIDPGHAVAASNLFLIYERQGDVDAARKLQARVDRHRRKNPYYLYQLSSQAAEQGQYEESTAMLQKAIKINETEYRFHYELARLQALGGDLEAAQLSLDRATELSPDGLPISGASIENLPDLPE